MVGQLTAIVTGNATKLETGNSKLERRHATPTTAMPSDRPLKDQVHKMIGAGHKAKAKAEPKLATAKAVKPEEVIPLDDKELKEF
jgi:hypothetical protein